MKEMEHFKLNGKTFAFAKLVDPLSPISWDIIAIFEVLTKDGIEEYKFVNYVYGASFCDTPEDVLKLCMPYIEDYALNLNVLTREV